MVQADTVQVRPATGSLPPRAVTDEPVGILGAGVGGLYTALMLQSLNVSYEIIEASNRTRGQAEGF
jgi:monoamine oxidase